MSLFGIEHSVFLLVFWLFFDKIQIFFNLCLKYIRYVCRKLVLRFVGDENDLHRVCVMVDYNKLNIL